MALADLTTCLASATSGLAILAPTLTGKEAEILKYMDRVLDMTFYDFIFLRKAANAMHHCGD